MTEGGVTRMKRNGARLFRNPPQPHMCIQDYIQGTTVPCYVNVLSWEKITMPLKSSVPVPLYGGMRVRPPRTKAEAVVFAVMTNPGYLQINGKNATDPKKRSCLIELLLDFVETVNAGVVFTRQYTILKDRDITGELKDVWNAVQARRDLEQPPPQQETWIDAQPPVPQYPQYQDHQQQEYTSQPPQYHTSVAFGRAMNNGGMHYESYGYQSQTQVIPQNDQMYQSRRIVQKQNCPAYPARECHMLFRRMDTLYSSVDSYVHPNPSLNYGPPANTNINQNMNTNLAVPYQQNITYQQRMDDKMHMDMRRMQPQQQQIHMNHVQPVPQYEPAASFISQMTSSIYLQKLGRPHLDFGQKNNGGKRQVNSPTHSKQSSCTNCQNKDISDNGTKPKSPVKVLQRELPSTNRQDANHHAFTDKVATEKNSVEETKNVQVTDLDEEVKKDDESDGELLDSSRKSNDTRTSDPLSTTTGQDAPNTSEDGHPSEEKLHETKHTDVPNGQNSSEQKYPKSKAIIIKGNKHKESTSKKCLQNSARYMKVWRKNVRQSELDWTNHKGNAKTNGENEEPQQGYTILKKSDSMTHEEVMSELAQISIQDCKEATEVSPVLS
ncbi:basic-leucine zipper transcription factor A [Hylaeus volcanicus]|uniref:basic-leucine zipper transcription factor A n=1 Tax=Hylaeus volcanicus TaxID=313075 RepID=UPI0023B7F8AF|nr:basic-leucine zipper transcription factor A [Hylaeus volcanicus]XP_053986254.1 basic-leucine zipper transcription factor A [Hylaeus volcanicus]XP_053986255.1 basic-leucine zipper transcription factor A [Hylaeus volcanicus]